MNKITKILMLSIGLASTTSYAQFEDLMTRSTIVKNTPSEGMQVISTLKDRNELVADAERAALAAYNRADVVNLKSPAIRTQKDNALRDKMIADGEEITTFNATIKKNSLLGDKMANGELPAGFVSYFENEGKARIKVAFHGTECNRDLLTDLNVWKHYDKTLIQNGKIHGGFHNRYNESREAMLKAIRTVLAAHGKTADQVEFVVTGHSLGGALATLAAVDLKKTLAKPSKLYLVTVASPRVFNAAGAKEAEYILDREHILRMWREKDPIPAVSLGTTLLGWMTGFKHVGISVKQKANVDSWSYFSMDNHDMEKYYNDAISPKSVAFTLNHEGYKTLISNKISNALDSVKSGFVNIAKTIGSKLSKLNPFNWFAKKDKMA